MNVRRPECDEQTSSRTSRYAAANQLTMLTGRMAPPRTDRTTGPAPAVNLRQSVRAARRLGGIGISSPLLFLAALSRSSIKLPISPVGPSTMSHVNLAISPARKPALIDKSTISLSRMGLRVLQAKNRRHLS